MILMQGGDGGEVK